MELRKYQQEAIDAAYKEFRRGKNSALIVLPTGSGKTPVIARVAQEFVQYKLKVLILAHVKELLEQTHKKLTQLDSNLDVGIYSAGMGFRDTDCTVLVAGIQSVWRLGSELGKRDIIIVDEVHRIGNDESSCYQTLLSELRLRNPGIKILGLTATPYRLAGGMIYGEGKLFQRACYSAPIRGLIEQGYLSQLRNKCGTDEALPDLEGTKIRAGEFVQKELAERVDKDELVCAMVRDILKKAKGRQSVIVFATSVEHAFHIWNELNGHGEMAALLTGSTPSPERNLMIEQFKRKEIRILVNVSVLTEGFDAPGVDCVVLARPTASRGLYYQMVGRGFRLSEGKADCLVLDYGNNIYRHGPIDAEVEEDERPKGTPGDGKPPMRTCPECKEICHAAIPSCPDCGHNFPERSKQQCDTEPDQNNQIISEVAQIDTRKIYKAEYMVHTKKGADESAPKTLRAIYHYGVGESVSEWICVEHEGYARRKAEAWWKKHTNLPCPATAVEAEQIANSDQFDCPTAVRVRKIPGSKWNELIGITFEIPETNEGLVPDDDLPF